MLETINKLQNLITTGLLRLVLVFLFTPQPLRAVRVMFSPMVYYGWLGGLAVGKRLSRLYLRNCKVQEVDTW